MCLQADDMNTNGPPSSRAPVRPFQGGGRSAWRVLIAAALLSSAPAHADPRAGAALAQQGAAGAPACVACHGAHGEGQAAAGFPRLAGQPQAYLLKQLQDFASGQRKSPQMEPIARALGTRQRRDAAEYYATLPARSAEAAALAPPSPAGLGARLATRGNWDKGLPACFACHGRDGTGITPHFPALSGQPSAYTRAQLKAWQAGTRRNDPQGLMKSVADRMTDAEIDAVSLYLENPASGERRP